MIDDIEEVIENAIYLRTLLQRLDTGETVIVLPGSHDEHVISNLIKHVDNRLRQWQKWSKPRPNMSKESTNPNTLLKRKLRGDKKKRLTNLVDRYLSVHSKSKE